MTATLPENPFPGMNPYLEVSNLWPGVHNRIIVHLGDTLARQLRPEYSVAVLEQVYVTTDPGANGGDSIRIPDAMVLVTAGAGSRETPEAEPERSPDAVAVQLPATELVRERYLEVRRVDNRQVIALIELLSPTNKSGDGYKEYLAKRADVLYSPTHLVEIDLLRAGRRMPVIGDVPNSHYRILVANARRSEPVADLYPFDFRQPIPDFVMPLGKGSEGIAVNLNAVVNRVYSDGSYDLDIDYQQDPEPPLSDSHRVWLDQLLREKGLRDTTV